MFSFLVPCDEVMLPNEWESVSAMDPEALGLASPTDEIHGLNMHMALYGTDLASYG